MIQLDTKYVVFALIVVLIFSVIYYNTKLTNLETLVQKHEQFNLHIGDAFKPIHQKYAEHEARISNIDDNVKSIKTKMNVIMPVQKRKQAEFDDDEEELLNKMKSS